MSRQQRTSRSKVMHLLREVMLNGYLFEPILIFYRLRYIISETAFYCIQNIGKKLLLPTHNMRHIECARRHNSIIKIFGQSAFRRQKDTMFMKYIGYHQKRPFKSVLAFDFIKRLKILILIIFKARKRCDLYLSYTERDIILCIRLEVG